MESEWLIVLSPASRLAWVQLLAYVKGAGTDGRAKQKSAPVFARQNYIGEEDVEQMLRAAKNDGALKVVDGEWVVSNWRAYQGDETNAARQQRWRDRNGRNALRNTENEREIENPPIVPPGDETFEKFCRVFPPRKGGLNKTKAKAKWNTLAKKGQDMAAVIAGAEAFAKACGDKAGTEFVPMMSTWLNQERWTEDYGDDGDDTSSYTLMPPRLSVGADGRIVGARYDYDPREDGFGVK